MASWRIPTLVAATAAAGIATGWALRGPEGGRAPGDRSSPPAHAAPEAPITSAVRLARESCARDEAAELRLGAFDPETNLHSGRPEAFKLRREPARLEDEYRKERARRLELAERLVIALGPQLELTQDEAVALYRLLMERGDTARKAAYRKEAGLIPNVEKHAIRARAGEVFMERLRELLPPERVVLYEWAEARDGRDGLDLGFGAVYGMGGGKERFDEPLPPER